MDLSHESLPKTPLPIDLSHGKRMELKPSQILFSQFSVRDHFEPQMRFNCVHRHRPLHLVDVFKQLVNGSIMPEDLGPIIVVELNYSFYVYDGNKRLFVYKKLEKDNILKKIPVVLIPLEDEHFRLRIQARRYGFTAHCKDDLRIENKMNAALSCWVCSQTFLYIFFFIFVVLVAIFLIHYTLPERP